LKNRPVKASPQAYERWIKGLERELREILADAIGEDDSIVNLIREVLGE